ncbi:MAG: ferrochelatase [Thermodesulfovibrionales bacterium]|nr:ferrochelatase [Thermodesulfovibrionales bacterium]
MKKGIVLLNMGGPDSLQSVKPFLKNLFSDRDIIRLGPSFLHNTIASIIIKKRLKHTIHAYSLIGGKSPLIEITNQQAHCLEQLLKTNGYDITVKTGMRYWHPFIEDTLRGMKQEGINEVIGLSLYPQYSKATSGSTIKAFETSADRLGLRHKSIKYWYDHPSYIDVLSEFIKEGMQLFNTTPFILFSAHSLPQRFVDEGDPYIQHTEKTIKLVVDRIGLATSQYGLAFQSKTGPVKWVEPSTEDTLHRLAKKGIKDVLIVPVSFVSDHIETLYEIDMVYGKLSASLGINMKRTESFNTDSRFINALFEIVRGI